jgi:hypothetical protein
MCRRLAPLVGHGTCSLGGPSNKALKLAALGQNGAPQLQSCVRPHTRFTAAVNFLEEHHGQIPDLFSKRGNGCAR